eukprot:1189702-Prorocentrum_minimum.AAC.2
MLQRGAMALPVVLYLVVTRPRCFVVLVRELPILFATSLMEVITVICYLKCRLYHRDTASPPFFGPYDSSLLSVFFIPTTPRVQCIFGARGTSNSELV